VIESIFHINVNCTNLDRSLDFYKTLGFTVIRDLNEVGSEKLRRGLRIPDSRGRAVLLILGDNPRSTHLDLIEWKNPKHAGMCGEHSDDGEYGTDYGSEPRNRTRSRSHARVRGLARDSRSARCEVGTPGNTRGGCRHGRLRIG
jgi:catechol 2,3-dioxygenase-like lactoylglutathione lyase family enzyme